ncbi:MAG: hypothetical protein ACI4R9_08325 [Kiritimatiellia bacterium]
MTTKPCPNKCFEWWEFILLGLIPTFLGALSLATYLLGKNWNGILFYVLVSAGVLAFVSCFVFTLFKVVRLCRERRWAMAVTGLVLYAASASTVVLGMLYVLL